MAYRNDDRSVARREGRTTRFICSLRNVTTIGVTWNMTRRFGGDELLTSVCVQLRRSGRKPPGKRALTENVTAEHFMGSQQQPVESVRPDRVKAIQF
jgi:hypothetical protein